MSKIELKSPRTTDLSWGRVEVEGYPPFKDAKVFPAGARAWDWTETGTRHKPESSLPTFRKLIEHGAKTIVLQKVFGNDCRSAPKRARPNQQHPVEGPDFGPQACKGARRHRV